MSCYDCDNKSPTLAQRLDKRILVQRTATVQNEYGEPEAGWEDVAVVWAAIEPLRGQEFFAAAQENSEVTTRIRIRYREGIDRTMRVVYKNTVFQVLYIIHPEFARKELQLMCKEVQ